MGLQLNGMVQLKAVQEEVELWDYCISMASTGSNAQQVLDQKLTTKKN